MNSTWIRLKSTDTVVLGFLVVSLTANCIQAAYVKRAARLAKSGLARTEALRANDLVVVSPSGSRIMLPTNVAPTIVYVLSPTCKWCKLNQANFDSLVAQTHGKYDIMGVVPVKKVGDKRLEDLHVSFPVYSMIVNDGDPNSLSSTPETLVFNGGKLIRRWTGYYIGDTRNAIENFFDVKLPPSPSSPLNAENAH